MHFVRRGFQFPTPLNQALLQFFWNGRTPAARDLKKFSNALVELWPKLAKERGQTKVEHYSFQSSFAQAYAAYYLPANAMKLALILEEQFWLQLHLERTTSPLRWLDVGSGPGTALWGLSWWARHRDLRFSFHGLEQSKNFLKIAADLTGPLLSELYRGSADAPLVQWSSFVQDSRAPTKSKSLVDWIRETRPQVVSMMNSIGEMSSDLSARKVWIHEIVDALLDQSLKAKAPTWLILVEPGALNATRELLEVREVLRERELRKKDVKIWLPCLSARPCGALAKAHDWCHEEAFCQFPEWMDLLGREAGLKKESVLFSYLVVSIGEQHPTVPTWPSDGLRVVSQRMEEKGLTQCFLCTPDKLKQKARVLHSKANPENEIFLEVNRGQIFKEVQCDEKGSVLNQKILDSDPELDATVFPPLR